jgi:hypothetical protein
MLYFKERKYALFERAQFAYCRVMPTMIDNYAQIGSDIEWIMLIIML